MAESNKAPWTSLWFIGAGTVAIVFVLCYLLASGGLVHLQLENLAVVTTGSPGSDTISEIWFSPQHDLLATSEIDGRANPFQAASLVLRRWDLQHSNRQPSTTSVLLTSLRGAKPEGKFPGEVFGLSNSFHGGPEHRDPLPIVPYAVSDDGSTIACAWQGKLYAAPASGFKSAQGTSLSFPTQADALSFSADHLLTVIQSGAASYWDCRKTVPERLPPTGDDPLGAPGPWLIWSRGGPFRVLSSFNVTSPSAYRLSFEPQGRGGALVPHRIQFAPSRDGRSIVASPGGEVLFGSSEGFILSGREFGPSLARAFGGGINCLAFYDEKRVIACGEGAGLAFLEDGQKAKTLLAAPKAIRLLAVDPPHIAFATANSLSLGRLSWKLELDDRDKTWLSLMFSSVGLIAFFRLAALDFDKIRENRRIERAKQAAAAAARQPATPASGGVAQPQPETQKPA